MPNKIQNHSTKMVSVIMPCYNQADYVAEAIDSVLQQTYTNWELIIINDGSTDRSKEIIENKIKNIKNAILINIENNGLSNARNIGIQNSKGEFILPLDADDLITSNYMQLALEAFNQNVAIKLVYARAIYFGIKNEEWKLLPYNYKTLLTQNIIYCSAFFKKSDFDKTNGYDSNLIYGLEDWDLWLNLIEESDLVYQIPEICFKYRIKESSMLLNLVSKQNNLDYTQNYIYYKHSKLYTKYFGNAISVIRKLDIINNKNELYQKSTAYKVTNVLIKLFSLFKK